MTGKDTESDERVGDEILPALAELRGVEMETESQQQKKEEAMALIQDIIDEDRELHGETATDRLARMFS